MTEVIVGVDGSEGSRLALRWALEEARLRRTAVRAVLAWAPEGRPWAVDEAAPSTRAADLSAAAERFLAQIVAEAPKGDPPIAVYPQAVYAPPVEALTLTARDAGLLVVGARGLGGFARLLVGSVSQQCAQHAPVPVVVVHGPDGRLPAGGPVVVGIDGSSISLAALRFAAAEAGLRGAKLHVLHAWSAVPPVYPGGRLPTETHSVERAAREVLDASVRAALGPAPDVPLTARAAGGPSSSVLLAGAADAALLVVGSRGLGGFAGLLLGSTSHQCLSHARCPVAVIREAPDDAAGAQRSEPVDRRTGRVRRPRPKDAGHP